MSDSVETNATPQAKRMIGNFELIEKIGQGGMGTVHRARQISLDRIVALKILPPSIAKDAVFIDRFQKEARASAKLSHPNIVTGIDVGQDAKTGLWYFAMEYVDGPTLKEVLQNREKIPEAEALKLAKEIASALECLHGHGMVHRDIKPDNIIMTKRGDAKLADLGLAKDLKDDASLTQAGKAVGTPHFMAPEQVRGEISELDIRADIYAFGGTLYNLVTGKTPYSGETSAVIMSKHLTDPAPKAHEVNPEISLGFSKLIERMMQKKKEDRVQTPKELLELIEKVKRNEMTTGPRAAIRTTGPRAAVNSRGRSPLMIAAVVSVLLIGAIAYVVTSQKSETVSKGETPKDTGKAGTTETPVTPDTGAPKTVETPTDAGKTDVAVVPAEETAKKEEQLAKLQGEFVAAQLFEKEHPQDFQAVLKKYRQLNKQAEGAGADAISDQIEAQITDVQKRRAEVVGAEWTKIDGAVTEYLASNNYDLALRACETLPPAFAEALKERAGARAKELHAEAESKIRGIVQKAEELSAAAQPEDAIKALAPADKIIYEPTSKSLVELKKRFEGEIVNAAELKKKREAMAVEKAYEETLASFDKAVFEDKDIEAAKQAAADAQKNPLLQNQKERVKALVDVANALDDPLEHEQKTLVNLKGVPVDLQKQTGGSVKGTVKKVENGTLFVTMKMGTAEADFPVKLADLNEASRAKLTPPFVASTNAQRVALAIDRLNKDDAVKAEEWLNAAPENPIAAHLRSYVAKKKASEQKNASETAAAALFGEINLRSSAAKINEADTKILIEKITRFDTDFADTQFGKTVADKITAIKKKIGMGVVAPVNVLNNGDFDKGLMEPWEKGRGRFEVIAAPSAARTGRGGLQFTGERRGEAVTRVMLEEGASYTLSGWSRIAKGVASNYQANLYIRIGADDDENAVNFRTPQGAMQLGQWFHHQTTFVAPTSGEARLIIYVMHEAGERANNEARRGIIHFDDITLMKTAGDKAAPAAQRANLPPFEIPGLLRLAGISFWVSPKTCPQGTNRELLSNTIPTDKGTPGIAMEDGVRSLVFEGASLGYNQTDRMKASNGQAGTLVAWVKPRNVAVTQAVFGRCDKRYDDISLYIYNGKLMAGVDFDSQSGLTASKLSVTSKANVAADKWLMAAVTWDGKNYTLYMNGEKDSVVPSAIVPPHRATTVFVGENPPGQPESLSGHIGGVMIFDRNLSEGEIKGLFGLSGIPAR